MRKFKVIWPRFPGKATQKVAQWMKNARSAFQEGRKWMKKMTVKKIDKLMETRFQM